MIWQGRYGRTKGGGEVGCFSDDGQGSLKLCDNALVFDAASSSRFRRAFVRFEQGDVTTGLDKFKKDIPKKRWCGARAQVGTDRIDLDKVAVGSLFEQYCMHLESLLDVRLSRNVLKLLWDAKT